MKRLALGVALAFSAYSAHAEVELRPAPDDGQGPTFMMWRIETGQERAELCHFYRSSFTYQTGIDDEITVTVERPGPLESRLVDCLPARRFKE